MNGNPQRRTRSERAQTLGTQPRRFSVWMQQVREASVLLRLEIAAAAMLIMLVACQTWQPRFTYRIGDIPYRDIVARIDFEVVDVVGTQLAQARRRSEVVVLYRNDTRLLDQLRERLKNDLFVILDASSFEQMTNDQQALFASFWTGDETVDSQSTPAAEFSALKSTLAQDTSLTSLDNAVKISLSDVYRYGLLQSALHDIEQGNQRIIAVYPTGRIDESEQVEVSAVRITAVRKQVQTLLADQFRSRFQDEPYEQAARMVSQWLGERLPETLSYDDAASERIRADAVRDVGEITTKYRQGITGIATTGQPLDAAKLELLQQEWIQISSDMGWLDRILRVFAYCGMITALFLLGGFYLYFVDDRRLLGDPIRLSLLLALVTLTVSICYWTSRQQWQGYMIPLVLCAVIATVVYGRQFSLLLMACICLAVTLFVGGDLAGLVALGAASTSCILLLGRLRNRTQLLYVGLGSAFVVAATVIGVGIVTSEVISPPGNGASAESTSRPSYLWLLLGHLAGQAVWLGGCVVFSCLTMTGLLPHVERLFGVQTDLSLLELSDPSQPLLRQLAQRAPGTYNHSINVASIGEAAANEIGANGLLVRVGAYFHDIGKMFKPKYFIENQGQEPNQHDSLQPAMSTLVIIAHVKDGADLARTHHLPESIIDFIQQHHGTTLVEYFYREAAKRSEEDPNGEEVSDKDFRYPGPKPQTLEAAVMMLADTVESASRTLVDPTPARIKSLVDAIAMKKLSDGQFDECGLTLQQLDKIKQNMVKSLTAIYHARVKYPGQQSA